MPPLPRRLRRRIRALARVRGTLLLTGEVGTGKSTLARLIHREGPRAEEPFVRVDCAGLVSTIAQSELYGHEEGAFTGAGTARRGLIREAGSGTVLLDEISVLNGADQARLLTLLEERTVRPVGGTREVPVEARVICATNEDLETLVEEGTFRRDLYDRVAVLEVEVPPLRQRLDELPEIVEYLLQDVVTSELWDRPQPLPELSPEAFRALRSYPWPGNLRELRNSLVKAVFRAVVSDGRLRIEVDDLPEAIVHPAETDARAESSAAASAARYRSPKDPALERAGIVRALRATQVKIRAAELLGMSRSTLYNRIRRHGIDPSEWKAEEGEGST